VADEGVFDVALVGLIAQAEEIEMVRVLEDFGGEPSLRRGEPLVKVRDGQPLPKVELVFDLDDERVAGPSLPDGLPGIPFAQDGLGELGKKDDNVEPRQLVGSFLPNWV
jgi:hypothetical protein